MTVVLLVVGLGFFASTLALMAGRGANVTTAPPEERYITFLFIGLDTESLAVEKLSVRSDVLMVGCAALHSGEVRILSIPRDTYVKIPSLGMDKINHAFAFGGGTRGDTGAWLTRSAVKALLGITEINHHVVMDMAAVPRLVDALGGVTLEGRLFNGPEALDYVRFRGDGGDINRILRQQSFLRAVVARLAQQGYGYQERAELIQFALTQVKSSLSPTLALRLSKELESLTPQTLEMLTVPGKASVIEGISYWEPDMAALRAMVDHVFFGRINDGKE